MRKLISFLHISLDGFAATPKGEINWLGVTEEFFDIAGKMADNADTAIYGRKTYEIMEAYWPTAADKPDASKHDFEHSAWYKTVRMFVFSKTLKSLGASNQHLVSENEFEFVRKLKNEDGKNIIMFGSPTLTKSFFNEGLVDEQWLFVNPIVLGEGIPVFGGAKERIKLSLLDSYTYSNGVVRLHYSTK